MDAITLLPPAVSVPVLPQPASAPSIPTGGSLVSTELKLPGSGEASVDVQSVDQKRYEAVRVRSEAIANVFIVGDRRFTIFKDVTGQYITRFTSLRDGRVTYIPEPQLLKMSQGGEALNIRV